MATTEEILNGKLHFLCSVRRERLFRLASAALQVLFVLFDPTPLNFEMFFQDDPNQLWLFESFLEKSYGESYSRKLFFMNTQMGGEFDMNPSRVFIIFGLK